MSKLVPAAYAQIVWADNPLDRVQWIELIDKREPGAARAAGDFENWAGHDSFGWPTDGRETPIALFTRVIVEYGRSQKRIAEIVSVFAQIEECDWARAMQAEIALLNKTEN